jgi:hypothetical protein
LLIRVNAQKSRHTIELHDYPLIMIRGLEMRVFIALMAAFFVHHAGAAVTIHIVEVGSNLQATLSGRLDLRSVSYDDTVTCGHAGEFLPNLGYITMGGKDPCARYHVDVPWKPFGTESNITFDPINGDMFLAWGDHVILAAGYTSNTSLSATSTAYFGSFKYMGLIPGTHVTTLTNGAWSDTVTVIVGTGTTAEFKVSLEEPINGEIHSGIGNLRGFAFAADGIVGVEIYIDGKYAFDAPYGGSRTDVGEAYPEVEGAVSSGFSLAYGYSNLSEGEHTIMARALDVNEDFVEDTSTFTVVGFDKPFIFSNEIVDVGDSAISADGDEIFLEDVTVGNQVYDLKLKWRTAEQGFEIIEIR